ncbi:amino acid adenylation domain-containing protein, partial [Agrobacterium rhizogenes]|nr:amino acid adenylation domain-containing protein [Rhizobium rhizogenes]
YPHTPPATNVRPDNLAYVIYTSGSTGKPKGAMIEHCKAANLAKWYHRNYNSNCGRNWVIAPFSFDLSQKNLLSPLSYGGRISLAGSSVGEIDLKSLLEQETAILNCAPSHAYQIADVIIQGGTFPKLTYLILGGENIISDYLVDWLSRSETKLINSYGPTECTDVVLASSIGQFRSGTINILGTPISNTQIYVVDGDLSIVPVGVAGEICIGG